APPRAPARPRRYAAARRRARAQVRRRTTRTAAARQPSTRARSRGVPARARRGNDSTLGQPRSPAPFHPPITDICICKYIRSAINCKCNHFGCERRRTMSVKEMSRPALSEALFSKNPPIVFEALDRKYYDFGHIPTARILPPAETERVAAAIADKDQAIVVYCASVTCK